MGAVHSTDGAEPENTVQRTEHIYDAYNRPKTQKWTIGGKTRSETYTYDDSARRVQELPSAHRPDCLYRQIATGAVRPRNDRKGHPDCHCEACGASRGNLVQELPTAYKPVRFLRLPLTRSDGACPIPTPIYCKSLLGGGSRKPLRERLFTPQGRQLTSITTGGKTTTYAYDADGIRTEKVVGGVTHHYVTRGSRLMRESFLSGSAEIIMDFSYDGSGRSCCNSGSVVACAARSPIALLLPLARLP